MEILIQFLRVYNAGIRGTLNFFVLHHNTREFVSNYFERLERHHRLDL